VDVSGVGPSRGARHDVKLSEQATEHLIGVGLCTQVVELGQHLGQRALCVDDGVFGEEFALLFETAAALHEFFAVEV